MEFTWFSLDHYFADGLADSGKGCCWLFHSQVHLLMVEGFCLPIHSRDLPVKDGKVINDS